MKSFYKDLMEIVLTDKEDEEFQIITDLDLLDYGTTRIVYDLGDRVLKVALCHYGITINNHEINLHKTIKGKDCKIKFNELYDWDENACWYVAEKVNISLEAMKEALKIIPSLDNSANAGYDNAGRLTIVDAEGLDYTYFIE